MANKIVIAELDIDVNALIKNTTQLKAEIDRLKQAQKELTKEGQTASKEFVQNAADLKSLNSAYNANVKAIADQTQATADATARTQLLEVALNAEVTSIKEAREQNALLTRLRNEANATTAEGIEEIRRLNNALDANNAFIKDNVDAYTQQKINIGNYKESISEALGELNLFNGGIGGFIQRSQEAGGVGNLLKGSMTGAAQGLLGLTKASLAFIATPVGAVIAALVAVFAAVKVAMDRSETATNKIKVAFSAFSGIINTVLKALEPLGEFLIDGIVMGLELAGKAAEKWLGVVGDALDFLGFDSAADGVRNFTNEIKEGVKEAQELAKAENELEASQRKSRLTQLEYQKTAEKFRQIRDDENKTIAERIAANEELGKVLQQQLKDELAIAEQALKVAELRIKAEGATKANLDAQAEALTEIADIQERITGQESEQLTNRVSLQKEAADKAKEIREKAIQDAIDKSRQEIELFIAQQGFRKKSTEEEYQFNKDIYDRELKDLELRYSKGKVSKLEYETEKLNLSTEFAQRNAELLISEGERELEIIKNNAKLGIDAKLQAELDFQALRLEQGIINEQQYQDAIKAIEDDYAQQRLDKRLQDEQAERERKAIDIENKLAGEQLSFENEIELEKERNAIRLEEELLAAEKSGADKKLILDKYANIEKMLDQAVIDNKIQQYSTAFGQLSSLFGQQSALGKAFALYQIGVDTYVAAQKAYASQLVAGDPSSPVRATIAAATAVAGGIRNAAKVSGAKFETGGIIGIEGKRHSSGGEPVYVGNQYVGEVEGGEGIGILNRNAFGSFMDFNNQFGNGSVNSGFFQGGGIITQGVRQDSLSLDSVVDAIANMPAPVVAVEEIQSVGNRFVDVQNTANLG